MKTIILCDFDGTITTHDTLVRILDTFAGPAWRTIDKRIISEESGNRISLKQKFSLCDPKKATKEAIVCLLKEEIEIDPYFKPFLEFLERENCEFLILSGGFSICIDIILKKYNLENLPYYANKLLFPRYARQNTIHDGVPQSETTAGEKDKLDIEYPYSAENCRECGNCKTMHLNRYRSMGYYIIYIGDSATDRCPARYADLVFAKGYLSNYCLKEKISHVRYETFADIQACLTEKIPMEEKIYNACLPTNEQGRQGEKK